MPESSSSAIHGYCLYDWDGSQWVLQPNGNHCHPGYVAQAPNGDPSHHGGRENNVPGQCVQDTSNEDSDGNDF